MRMSWKYGCLIIFIPLPKHMMSWVEHISTRHSALEYCPKIPCVHTVDPLCFSELL